MLAVRISLINKEKKDYTHRRYHQRRSVVCETWLASLLALGFKSHTRFKRSTARLPVRQYR